MKRRRVPTADRSASRIPAFADRQQEAAWWDSHDITDYLDELEPVTLNVANRLSDTVVIHLDTRVMQHLAAMAQDQGMDSTALVTTWVLERLQSEVRQAGAADSIPGGSSR